MQAEDFYFYPFIMFMWIWQTYFLTNCMHTIFRTKQMRNFCFDFLILIFLKHSSPKWSHVIDFLLFRLVKFFFLSHYKKVLKYSMVTMGCTKTKKGNRTFTRSAHRNEPFLNGLSYSYIIDI